MSLRSLCLLSLLTLLSTPALSDELVVGGTGAALGGMQRLAELYQREHPDDVITVLPSIGSGGGIKAVLKGKIGLGISARPLKDKEKAAGAVATAYARTPFIFVTASAPGRAGAGFSSAELIEIFAGERSSWPDGQPLRPVLRPLNDSDSSLLLRSFPELDGVLQAAHGRRGALVGFTDQDAMDLVERLPGTVGTATLAAVLSENRPLTPLALNGVAPDLAALAAGRYPMSKTLRLVTTAEPPALARRFVEFIRSPVAIALLQSLGHLPE